MGMHGPLTALALGRSPYDDVVEGEGEEDLYQPPQQYDHHGRPVNPETRRINREMVRAHNEVMLAIGVAETEMPALSAESKSLKEHIEYEEAIGVPFVWTARYCVEAVGFLGTLGLRHRILTYRRFSDIPCWTLLRAARHNFSISRDFFAGAPTLLVKSGISILLSRLSAGILGPAFVPNTLIFFAWDYVSHHLELYAALQHLGLAPSLRLPGLSFFIPSTDASPIVLPSWPEDFALSSFLGWLSGALVSNTALIAWSIAQRCLLHTRLTCLRYIGLRLPSTAINSNSALLKSPPPSHSSSPQLGAAAASGDRVPGGNSSEVHAGGQSATSSSAPAPSEDAAVRPDLALPPSSGGDEHVSDEEDNEGVSATLISFDVEATDSAEAHPGLWSAELRPSQVVDARTCPHQHQPPVYLDTVLTRTPAMLASFAFSSSITRIVTAPLHALALRQLARAMCARQGRPTDVVASGTLLGGLTLTLATNFLANEFLHCVLTHEVWAVFTTAARWLHETEEWRENEAET